MQPGYLEIATRLLENATRVFRKCNPGKIRIVLENATRVLENVIRVSRKCNPAGSHFLAGSQILVTDTDKNCLRYRNISKKFNLYFYNR